MVSSKDDFSCFYVTPFYFKTQTTKKMKRLKVMILIVLSMVILMGTQSCLVLTKKDNGKHKGWYKNKKNPHNPKHNNSKKNKNAYYVKYNKQMPNLQHKAFIPISSNNIIET
jgi:flagellar basal body-associated protein FliL